MLVGQELKQEIGKASPTIFVCVLRDVFLLRRHKIYCMQLMCACLLFAQLYHVCVCVHMCMRVFMCCKNMQIGFALLTTSSQQLKCA